MIATFCTFRRTEDSEIEHGIAVGEDDSNITVIVDKEYKTVPAPVWSCDLYPYEGCISQPD